MKRIALGVIFVSMLAIAAGYASAFLPGGAPAGVAWLFALAIAALMIAVLVLGAARKGASLGMLKWVFGFCFACLAVGFSLALLAPAVAPESKLWLGLPQGAAIILYVVGFLPMLVLPIAYALTFDHTTLSSDELERLRARLEELRK
ncbi:MAG: hypothetical protein ACT4O1_07415 [Gemmatimonadota bacterium]